MKYFLTTIMILFCIKVNGQSLSKTDSLEIVQAVNAVFETLERPNYKDFKAITLDSIKCAICDDGQKGAQSIGRSQFFNKNLASVSNHDLWKRAIKRENQIIVVENKPWSDVSVFFQTYKLDELAKGHEGAQLGLWFKKDNGMFKLAGIETIP